MKNKIILIIKWNRNNVNAQLKSRTYHTVEKKIPTICYLETSSLNIKKNVFSKKRRGKNITGINQKKSGGTLFKSYKN